MSNINDLFITATKLSANKDYENAAKCYAELIDNNIKDNNEETNLDVNHLFLFAKALYQKGLNNNQMFNDDGEDDEFDDEEFGNSDDEQGEENQEDENIPYSDENLYQFDLEEEDLDNSKSETLLKENDDMNGSDDNEEDEEEEEEDIDDNTFSQYLTGNIFKNAIKVSYIAMSVAKQEKNDNKKKLKDIYILIGDLYQELEDFNKSIEFYKRSIEIVGTNTKDIAEIYIKLSEAVRWATSNEISSKKRINLLKQSKNSIVRALKDTTNKLEPNIRTLFQESIKQIKQDILYEQDPSNKNKVGNTMSLLQQALQQSLADSNVSDLSGLIKKKKK